MIHSLPPYSAAELLARGCDPFSPLVELAAAASTDKGNGCAGARRARAVVKSLNIEDYR
jgi:hypothetical protein